MKIALLGNGKTGSKIVELAQKDVVIFDSKNLPTREKLSTFDIIISFLPGNSFIEYIPMLLETKKSMVIGSTGFSFPQDLNKKLEENHLTWIHGTNFSLGMIVVKNLIKRLHEVDHILKTRSFTLHEVHHTKKLDAPSGTALSMKEWLNEDCEITSERTGDVIGYHELTLDTGNEKIKISHEALDRKLFAEGALWAAELIYQKKTTYGLLTFSDVAQKSLSL